MGDRRNLSPLPLRSHGNREESDGQWQNSGRWRHVDCSPDSYDDYSRARESRSRYTEQQQQRRRRSRSRSPPALSVTADDNSRDKSRNSDKSSASRSSSSAVVRSRTEAPERETDPRRLAQRQKQIDFGKNTIGYDNYIAAVPRRFRTRDHPWTPDPKVKRSRRAWGGLVQKWRRMLHQYDDSSMVVPIKTKSGAVAGVGDAHAASSGSKDTVTTAGLAIGGGTVTARVGGGGTQTVDINAKRLEVEEEEEECIEENVVEEEEEELTAEMAMEGGILMDEEEEEEGRRVALVAGEEEGELQEEEEEELTADMAAEAGIAINAPEDEALLEEMLALDNGAMDIHGEFDVDEFLN